ncbi:zinc finger protein 366-like [Ctenocephalides felis]|uniref:zinc finger protein 366-like n=1 Tax=Ctenocephalides felis TaxID=7515 RepID=UPI000E6E20AC|nr:zinc finger protein 366-like [Ctenocephalides felis]
MSEETIMSMNDQTIKIEPPEYSPEDIKLEMEDEFDYPDVAVKSESCSEDDDTCLERFMNSEVKIEEEVKQELVETLTHECDICNRLFTETHHLKEHMIDHMPNDSKESPFKCEICYKTFNQLRNVKQHMLIHSGSLKSHMLIHKQEHSCKCEVCNKEFTQSNDLKRHRALHSQKRGEDQ